MVVLRTMSRFLGFAAVHITSNSEVHVTPDLLVITLRAALKILQWLPVLIYQITTTSSDLHLFLRLLPCSGWETAGNSAVPTAVFCFPSPPPPHHREVLVLLCRYIRRDS